VSAIKVFYYYYYYYKVDFDALFRQNTWRLYQTPVQEFDVKVFEIDKRQSIKKKRSEKDDSKRKLPGLSDEVTQICKLSCLDNPVRPESTSGSLKSSGVNQRHLKVNEVTYRQVSLKICIPIRTLPFLIHPDQQSP